MKNATILILVLTTGNLVLL